VGSGLVRVTGDLVEPRFEEPDVVRQRCIGMTTGRFRAALVPLACGMVLAMSACGNESGTLRATDPPLITIEAPTTTTPPDTTTPAPSALATLATTAPSGGLLVPGLPALADPLPTYVWSADWRPTRDHVQALADALDVDGDVSHGIYGADGGWTLDGDNLELMLDEGAEGAWSYSGPPPFPWPSESEPWPTIETGEPATIAPAMPAPGTPLPDTFPSQPEAQTLAREIVSRLGLDPETFEWRDGPRTFAAQVEAWWVVGGDVAPVKFDFGFGPEGVLVHASGQLVAPQAGPRVDRIGTAAAEERLRAAIGRSGPLRGGFALIGGVVALGDPDATIVLSGPRPLADAAAPPSGESPVHPTTAPPPTVPPELVGRIVEVEESWHVVRDESGTRLLPAYTFIEATGMRYTVSAVP
jgi:hypothetical protein